VVQHEEVEDLVMNHFKSLLLEPSHDRIEAIRRITRNIPHLILRDINLALMRAVTLEEVEEVVKGMVKNKAMGLGNLTMEFL